MSTCTSGKRASVTLDERSTNGLLTIQLLVDGGFAGLRVRPSGLMLMSAYRGVVTL